MQKNRPTITAHVLVKNEEVYISAAINSVLPFVDKMIIFDTGSTDKTIEIIKEILANDKDKKITFEEKGEVDKQQHTDLRNEMIKRTNTDWILLLDGDEIWDSSQILNLITELSYQPKEKVLGLITFHLAVNNINYYSELGHFYYSWGLHSQVAYRVIRNVPGIVFCGKYLEEGIYINEKRINSFQEHYFCSTSFYYHLSKLPRSSQDSKVWERKKITKFKLLNFIKKRYLWKRTLKLPTINK